METVNVELIIALATGLLAAVIVGLVAYFTSKNPQAALLEALTQLAQQKATMDALEGLFADLPEATRNMLRAVVLQAVEIAKSTDTPLDDALVQVLNKATDGEPNTAWVLHR